MITLKRLYSETNLFDPIIFKSGINIILGRYSNNEKREGINGIGKSSVIRLIDLALLGEESRKHFSDKKYAFLHNHSFTLEFEIGDQVYRIKRLFDNDKKLANWFSEVEKPYQEYEEEELKNQLCGLFFLNDQVNSYVENAWFRDLIRFFVKDDMKRQGRTNPIDFVSDGKFKPTDISLFYKNFFLLGLPNTQLFEYEEIDSRLNEQKKYKKRIIQDIEKSAHTKIEVFKSQQFEIEKSIAMLERATEEYRLLPLYEDAEKELISLSSKINGKLLLRNKLLKEKENYEKSFQIDLQADLQKVEKIYKEVNTDLANFIKKSLDDVVAFRRRIVENRKSFLHKRQMAIKQELSIILDEINSLELRRSNIYKILNEKKALDGLKNTYQELIAKKTELEKNKTNLHKIAELEIEISKIVAELTTLKTQIVQTIQNIEQVINNLRELFYEILENSIFFDENKEGWAFDIQNSDKGKNPIKFEVSVPKSGSKGNEFFKLMAYDLTVFLNIVRQKRNIPNFLIHDGVYDEIEPMKTIKILNYIHNQCLHFTNLQYIIVANQFELEITEEDRKRVGNYQFDLYSNVIAEYQDIPEKMFFRKSFSKEI